MIYIPLLFIKFNKINIISINTSFIDIIAALRNKVLLLSHKPS